MDFYRFLYFIFFRLHEVDQGGSLRIPARRVVRVQRIKEVYYLLPSSAVSVG